jgi:hypothetical protein
MNNFFMFIENLDYRKLEILYHWKEGNVKSYVKAYSYVFIIFFTNEIFFFI